MSNRKKVVLIILCILINTFLILGFLYVRNVTMLNELKKEAKVLSGVDITKDRYNRRVRTRGNYGLVEKTAKNYLDDYAISLQSLLNVMTDPKLTKLFSYDNYMSDGPEFKNSLLYLQSAKEEFNSQIDSLLNKSEEDVIREYGKERISDSYFFGLYLDIIFNDSMKTQFFETKSILEQTKVKTNDVFDISEELLNFLIINRDLWKLEEGEIRFQTEALYNQYNQYVSRLGN